MARYKTYDYRQRVFLPVCLEDQLMPGTLELPIHSLVEKRLDLSIFDGKYRNDETGRAAYDPKILLQVVLLAYSRGLISSRKIEQACRENAVFLALACGQQPDHRTRVSPNRWWRKSKPNRDAESTRNAGHSRAGFRQYPD